MTGKELLETWLNGFANTAKNENSFEVKYENGILSARLDGKRFALFAPEGLDSIGVSNYEELKEVDPLA